MRNIDSLGLLLLHAGRPGHHLVCVLHLGSSRLAQLAAVNLEGGKGVSILSFIVILEGGIV